MMMVLPAFPAIFLLNAICFYSFISCQQISIIDDANSKPNFRYILPDLPIDHYQYWLKNNPSTYNEFKKICFLEELPQYFVNLTVFRDLHQNLTFESPRYLNDLSYGLSVLQTICSKIDEIPKSCWGYENNCHHIYLMPECHSRSKDEQEYKISWFNQADFGFILQKARELSRFCLPDKDSNHTSRSKFECTKNFKMCRGENLMIEFKKENKGENFVESIGGWNCDLQEKRIEEEAGQFDFLESWYDELKGYNRFQTDPLSGKSGCDQLIEEPVFFIKVFKSASIDQHLRSIFNLYATMHLNNKFYDNSRIVLWSDEDDAISEDRYNLLWQSFTKYKPLNLRDFLGKQVCFKKFIFALPPEIREGPLKTKSLMQGCKKSGLFDAFNKHILHKLNISHDIDANGHIRHVPVKRFEGSRFLMNEHEILEKLNFINGFKVDAVDFTNIDSSQSITLTHKTSSPSSSRIEL